MDLLVNANGLMQKRNRHFVIALFLYVYRLADIASNIKVAIDIGEDCDRADELLEKYK